MNFFASDIGADALCTRQGHPPARVGSQGTNNTDRYQSGDLHNLVTPAFTMGSHRRLPGVSTICKWNSWTFVFAFVCACPLINVCFGRSEQSLL